MTIRHVRLFATVTPIAVLVVIEIVRYFVIGPLAIVQRLILDAVTVTGIVIFTAVIFRFVSQIHERMERRNRELLALHSAGLDVASALSLDIVLKKVVEQARHLVGARYGALSVIDKEGNIKEFITSGISDEARAAIGPPPVGHGVLQVVLKEGQHLRLDNLRNHPRSVGFPPNHPVMKTLLAVPVITTSPFLGNIYLSEKYDGSVFTADDEETLERFAVQASLAIDNAHLHAQAAETATAQERLRIAHEMHDGLAQVLGYVNTKAQAVNAYLARNRVEEARVQLEELAVSARQAYGDVRESIVGLRTLPGENRPLSVVIADFLQHWREQSGVDTNFAIEDHLRLKPSVELQVVRIIQESLTNVRKHAKATRVNVSVQQREGRLFVEVRDDGIGFSRSGQGKGEFPRFGLTTMQERASSIGGNLEIDSRHGSGTRVRFTMPVSAAVA